MSYDCWNRIGVRGDRSCPELERHVHCRNCSVYSSAAQALLDRPLTAADIADRTGHFAAPEKKEERGTQAVVIFRVGTEWLALPMAVVTEITELRTVHSLPHRRGGALLGVTNVRGELLICVSLEQLLGLEPSAAAPGPRQLAVHKRFIVLRRGDVRAVCPADEVHGIHRVGARDLQDAPATVAKAAGRHSSSVLMWRSQPVGLLDDELLFHALQRSVA